MLKINNISKNFGSVEVLRNINFEVSYGEVVGLIGENGAGKSTLLRILSTMLKPDSGTVDVCGVDLIQNPSMVRENVGILFGSEAGLYDRLTVRENLVFFARLYGIPLSQAESRVSELAQNFGFENFENQFAHSLSRGMCQKAAIARSLIHDPQVMLFDEPDSGLDFKSAHVFFNFLDFCRNKQKVVIFSSHSMENIKLYSDKVVVIRHGEIIEVFDSHSKRDELSDRKYNEFLFTLICGET
ncbi:MAG: ATP-binding cassette domain-containing protein [Oscillospiraceae bacterium]|jgi:sodium transport system ATP-binding protein|nr:ATP-binding cassette domain-containing protein [Oscillospiraceae bacterium]